MNYWHSDYALAQAATELAKQSGSDSPTWGYQNVSYLLQHIANAESSNCC
jgi:hypothetical protein